MVTFLVFSWLFKPHLWRLSNTYLKYLAWSLKERLQLFRMVGLSCGILYLAGQRQRRRSTVSSSSSSLQFSVCQGFPRFFYCLSQAMSGERYNTVVNFANGCCIVCYNSFLYLACKLPWACRHSPFLGGETWWCPAWLTRPLCSCLRYPGDPEPILGW